MSRTVPFDKDGECDVCGNIGVYDFMGDLICPECAEDEKIIERREARN